MAIALNEAQQAFNHLKNNPKDFLRKHQLSISVNIPNSLNDQKYQIRRLNYGTLRARPSKYRGIHKMREDTYFRMEPRGLVAAGLASHNFRAHVIATYNDFNGDPNTAGQTRNIPHFLRCPPPGVGPYRAALILTTQLSGCSFVIRPSADNSIDCAHCQPPPGANGRILRDNLKNNAGTWRKRGAGPIIVYGLGDYDNNRHRVTIIGVWRGTSWKIYAQLQLNDGNYAVQKIKRIYPPA